MVGLDVVTLPVFKFVKWLQYWDSPTEGAGSSKTLTHYRTVDRSPV